MTKLIGPRARCVDRLGIRRCVRCWDGAATRQRAALLIVALAVLFIVAHFAQLGLRFTLRSAPRAGGEL